MCKGKDKCEFLRNIRRQVADKYGLKYEPQECHHEGDCPGTCPACDAELKDLQRQLKERGIDDIDIFEEVESNEAFDDDPNLGIGIGNPIELKFQSIFLQGDVLPPDEPEQLQGLALPPDNSDDDNL
jgi:hypothetical protein